MKKMSISPVPALVAFSTFALSAVAFSTTAQAEDARLTCTGTVATVLNGGVATQPFASAAVGDAVTIQVDVAILHDLGGQPLNYAVNWPTCSVAIGSASDGIVSGAAEGLTDFDWFNAPLGNLIFQGYLESSEETLVQVALFGGSPTSVPSGDLRDSIGTSVPLAGWDMWFRIRNDQGSVEFSLNSIDITAAPGAELGSPYCAAVPNVLGNVGMLSAFGLATPADSDLTLTAYDLPPMRVGYFLVSSTQGFSPGAGGSVGNLCLSGTVGRFRNELKQSDSTGKIVLPLYLDALPGPTGTFAVQAGETWNFQLWHRDFSPATGPISNFTRALSITFQ